MDTRLKGPNPPLPPRTPIVGVYSPVQRSGKSIAGDVFVSRDYTRLQFSSPLKWMFRTLCECADVPNDYIDRMIDGDLKEDGCPELMDLSFRRFATSVGTDWGRKFNEDFWINILASNLDKLSRLGAKRFIIDDVRFPNEMQYILDSGGFMISVERSRHAVPPAPFEGQLSIFTFDYHLVNESRDEFIKDVAGIVDDIERVCRLSPSDEKESNT